MGEDQVFDAHILLSLRTQRCRGKPTQGEEEISEADGYDSGCSLSTGENEVHPLLLPPLRGAQLSHLQVHWVCKNNTQAFNKKIKG